MPLVSLLGTTLIMLAASLAVESQSAVNHICPGGEAHMKVDPGKLAQDYPAQSRQHTARPARAGEQNLAGSRCAGASRRSHPTMEGNPQRDFRRLRELYYFAETI